MKLYYKWVDKYIDDLTNKTYIITGANIGIGYYITLYLAYKNAHIIMACRNLNKANKAKNDILNLLPNANIDIMNLDISSKESINKFVYNYQQKYHYCHGIIHNAGVYHLPLSKTIDGYETVMATNYLGVYLLTNKILPILKNTAESRIVFTSSISHRWSNINYSDFFSSKKYKPTKVYAQSKLAVNKYFVYLSKKLENSNIKVCISHPGISSTNLLNSDKGGFNKLFSKIGTVALKLLVHSPSKASLSALYALANKNVKNKDIYGPRGLFEISGYPKKRKLNKKSYQNIEFHYEFTQKLLKEN